MPIHRTFTTFCDRTMGRVLLVFLCVSTCGIAARADEISIGVSGAVATLADSVEVTFTLEKNSPDVVRGFHMNFQLSPELDLTSGLASIDPGDWLEGFTTSNLQKLDLGGGQYSISWFVLGNPCDQVSGGDLFRMRVSATSSVVTSGTVTVAAIDLFRCDGTRLSVTPGPGATIDIDIPLVDSILDLASAQTKSANGPGGRTAIQLTFTMPVGGHEAFVYRAPFGNYPEYDDAGPGVGAERKVNFQPAAAPTPSGYTADTGAIFTAERGFGWLSPVATTARGLLADDPRDTFARKTNSDPTAVWEHVVPNGDYDVRVSCGDPWTQGSHRVSVENVLFFNGVLTQGGAYADLTKSVTVADGRLSLVIGGVGAPPPLTETKVNFIEIRAAGLVPSGGDAGAPPASPTSFPPGPPWVETNVKVSGAFDTPPQRDFWYYVAFVKDAAGNVSAASQLTAGTLDYHLGDFHDASANCAGDNTIGISDFSFLGSHYGRTLSTLDGFSCLDIGPTSSGTVDGRPLTDNLVDFKDLLIFSLNFGEVAKSVAAPVPAASNRLAVEIGPEDRDGLVHARITGTGNGVVQALSLELDWNAHAVQPVDARAGAWLEQQHGVVLVPRPGTVDVALLGRREIALAGEGVLANVVFRRVGPGDPAIRIASIEARDAGNRRLEVALGAGPLLPAPRHSRLLGAHPNPFNPSTRIAFRVEAPGGVTVSIYTLAGRRIKTLLATRLDIGAHELGWDGTDDRGARVASGVYHVRLVSEGGVDARPIVLVK